MNTTVDFEIAKLLKDKGWNKPTLHFFFEDGVLIENSYEDTVGMDYGASFEVEFSELTDNWNSGWVKKKDGNMCFGCDKSKGYFDIYSAPTIAEVVMWLYEKHRIWATVYTMDKWLPNGNDREQLFDYSLKQMKLGLIDIPKKPEEFDSPIEAYEAAIIYTLNDLIP